MATYYDLCKELKALTEVMTLNQACTPLRPFMFESEKATGVTLTPVKVRGLQVRIADVKVLAPNKVVEVTFGDGRKEKAVCAEGDVFNMETAISICITKYIMGGSGAYNTAVKQGMKIYTDKMVQEQKEKEEKECIEKKRAKKQAKRDAYFERKAAERARAEAEREAAEMEKQIEIQKQAYIRAFKEINSAASNC